jgi:hypothetical protein
MVCSFDCAIEYGVQQKLKQEANLKRVERKKTREAIERIKPKSKWLQEAQIEFNRYIRLRDSELPCISCGRFHKGQYHAGHLRSIGSSPHLRFNESNVHKQCSACNNHLSGNALNYRTNLISKIGLEAVEDLLADQTPKHYTIDDIKRIKAVYKAKCKELERKMDVAQR